MKKTIITTWLIPVLLSISVIGEAKTNYIWHKHTDYVAISNLDGTSQHNHPATIPAEKIARILSQLKVKNSPYNPDDSFWDDEDSNLQRVFTDREIDLLGKKLSDGLKKLKPSEVLVFSVSDYRSSFIGRKRLSVSATAFVSDNKLNLLFGTVHGDLLAKQTKSGITGTYGQIKNDLDTGSIIKPFPYDWKIPAFDGATNVKNRSDWLSINTENEYEYAVTKNKQQKVEEKYFTEKQKATETTELEARINKLEQQAKANTVLPTQNSSSIEERLRKLQSLYNSGALPEAVYMEKVRSIMSEL